MIIFKFKNEKKYIITSFKVMYTTLNNQENLIRVRNSKKFILHVLLNWISPQSKFYLLTRNPYDRIVSFYKSKFLSAEKVRLWMIQNHKGNWQKCTEYFFPFLDLNMETDPKVVSKKLMSTEFEKFIQILPYVYMEDRHMKPQYLGRTINIYKFGIRFNIPIKIERTFKIENEKDLEELSKVFNLDLKMKLNNTEIIDANVNWDSASIEIIERLYEKDFRFFEYEKLE